MNLLFYSICVAVAIICATATAASTPRLWRDGSRRHLRPQQQRHRWTRVGTYKQKHSKKQNVVPPQCTPDQFVGDYKYRNCQGVETKVRIACDMDKGTKNPCDYQEAPLKNDNTDDGCVVQGSFGATHIMKDPANPAVCQLNFVALKDSCKANESPSGFGMRAEVDMTAGHADTSTSTLVLWFSNDGGVVYYNEDEPQEPVFLHQDFSTERKLGGCDVIEPDFYAGPGTGTACTTDAMCKDKGHDCGRVGKKKGTDEWVYQCCKHGNYRKSWWVKDYCRKPVGGVCEKNEECEREWDWGGCGRQEKNKGEKKCCKHDQFSFREESCIDGARPSPK